MAQDKIALVTGGGSGIGRASALSLGRHGFSLVVCGRRQDALEETVRLGHSQGLSMSYRVLDVTDAQAVDRVFDSVASEFGRLDVLFNNAGVFTPRSELDALSLDAWRQAVEVNLTGAFLCARAAMRLMKQQKPQGGRIINNGSISAHTPRPGSAAYTATKHAITGLTKSIALDGRAFHIAASQIDIGNAETEIGGQMKKGVMQANGEIKPEPVMHVDQCGEAVAYIAGLPLDTNVLSMTLMATNMPFVGRG